MPILDWRDLQKAVKEKQTGIVSDNPDIDAYASVTPEQWDAFDKELDSYLNSGKGEQAALAKYGRDAVREEKDEFAREADVDDGYGEYKGDLDIPYDQWVKDPVNYRANSQSPWEKFWHGAVKMIPYAGTTFLDNTIGLIDGILNVAIDADVPGVTSKGRSFIDTPFAEAMQSVRDWSERVLPNYRTTEETEEQDEWWNHLNANFWGDTFLKNLGFTIGAGLSGAIYGKAFRMLQGKTVNKAYKAALAAAAGDGDAEAAFQKVLQGERMASASKIYDTFEKTSNSFKRLGLESQIVGGIGGAIGESRVEAMSAAKEFRDAQLMKIRDNYEARRDAIIEDYTSRPENTEQQPVYDGYGNVVGYQSVLSQDAQIAMQRELTDLQNEYNSTLQQIDIEADNLATATFIPNMFLLTATNMVMFGKMFSGGYKTQLRSKVKGDFGNYSGRGTVAGAIGKGIWNATTEGMEELSQKIISEGAKNIADTNMAAFHNKQYDKDSIKGLSETMMSMLDTAGNVISDPTSWEEFAVGFLTGALGMPTHAGVKNWSGGIIGGIQEGLENKRLSEEAAQKMNEITSDPEKIKMFKNLVRHNKLEEMKNDDLKKHDSFAWHTHNDEQLLNTVITFADAGRLKDLEDYVDSISNLSVEEVHNLRGDLIDETDPVFEMQTDEYVQNWLRKRGDALKRTINQYRNFYDSLTTLSLGTSDDEAIREMVYSQVQLQNFEDRYIKLLDETITQIRPYVSSVADERDSDGNPTKRAEQAQKLLSSYSNLQKLFGGYAADIHGADTSTDSPISMSNLIDDVRQEQVLRTLEEWGAFTDKPELKEQVSDLQKLVRSRQAFYARLFDPKMRKTSEEGYDKSAKTDEGLVEDLAKDARKKKVEAYMEGIRKATSLKAYLSSVNSVLEGETDPEVERLLDEEIQKDERLAKYNKTVQDAAAFIEKMQDAIAEKSATLEDAADVFNLEDVSNAINEMDFDAVLGAMKEDDDPVVALAKEILKQVSGNPRAEALARAILEEKLKDIATSNGLGTIPGAGEGEGGSTEGGEGTGGGEGSGGGNITQTQLLDAVLDKITDINDTTLNKIANGDFSDYPEIGAEDQLSLSKKAADILSALKKKLGAWRDPADDAGIIDDSLDTSEGEVDETDPRRIRAKQDFKAMDTGSISGSKFSVYSVPDLKRGVVRKFISKNSGTNATLNWMRKHRVQEFIDSGALAKLESEYKKKGQKLPIYFIGNPHFVENNLDANPFATAYTDKDGNTKTAVNLLLAIEMNDENREILKAYENAGVFSSESFVTVNDNGEQVQYQVIGELWNPTPSEVKKGGEEYQAVKSNSNLIWEHAVRDSIFPQYEADVRKASTAAFGNEGRWYVGKIHPQSTGEESETDVEAGERMHTSLNYIMSGRNETRAAGKGYEKIPLSESMRDYNSVGGEHYFALPIADETVYSSADSPEMNPGINAPQGSLWMATREANGAWAWTYITIARTDEFNFEQQKYTALVKNINAALDVIFAPNPPAGNKLLVSQDIKKRIGACRALDNMIYLGVGNTFSVAYHAGGPVLYVGGAVCSSKEEVFRALTAGKYRFQVSIDTVNDNDAMNDLIEAGVLRSEMRSFIRRGASIGVNFMSDKDADGNPVQIHEVGSKQGIARTAGQNTALAYGYSNGSVSNVRIGQAGYRLNEDGSVTRMTTATRPGERVTDKTIVAQVKAVAELMSAGDDALNDYSGKAWTVQRDNKQYTELYEKEVDGIIVRMTRRGKNGAIQLVYSNAEWEALSSVATPVGNNYSEPEVPVSDAEDLAALNAKRDKQLAEEQGGTVTPPISKKPKRHSRWGDKDALRKSLKENSPGSKTVEDATKADNQTEDIVDCG